MREAVSQFGLFSAPRVWRGDLCESQEVVRVQTLWVPKAEVMALIHDCLQQRVHPGKLRDPSHHQRPWSGQEVHETPNHPTPPFTVSPCDPIGRCSGCAHPWPHSASETISAFVGYWHPSCWQATRVGLPWRPSGTDSQRCSCILPSHC